jgi:hypothetical protein
MFVYLPRWSRYGTFATFALACSACTAPSEYSDLRPDGPPEVLTVSVNAIDSRATSGGDGATVEQTTFCKTSGPNDGAAGAGDPQRPDQVNTIDLVPLISCPEDLTMGVPPRTDAMPEAWYARIEFDELLDPSIEDLVANVDAMGVPDGTFTGTLANTQPVTLKCDSVAGAGQVDVPYDGYYSPSGDKISYPLGPSLVIIPTDPTVVATSSGCTVTLKENITDKDGNQVPVDQRGPYTWKIGAITVLAIDPTSADSKQDPIAAGVDITFNTGVTSASVKAGLPTMAMPVSTSTVFAFAPALLHPYAQAESAEEYFFGQDFPVSGGPYTFTLLEGAKLIDQCGKSQTLGAPSVDDQTQTSLTTNALKLGGITGATEPGNKIKITFNQYMDPSTLDPATEFSISPALAAPADVENSADGNLLVNGNFNLGTMYTFTLKNAATIDDCPGFAATCVKSTTYSSPMDQVVTFTTASAILLKSVSPKDNASESAATANGNGILLTFNDDIDDATFTAASYTITPPLTLAATNLGSVAAGTYEQVELDPTTPFVPGTYTFTLKGTGGGLKDRLGNAYSGTDQVVHFTVTANNTTPHVCL